MINKQYDIAKKPWDDLYGRQSIARRNWQLAAAAFAGLAGLFGAIDYHLAHTQRVVPYLVMVDHLGTAITIPQPLQPALIDERIKIATVAAFIRNARSVSPDQWQEKYYLLDSAYAFVRGAAYQTLTTYESDHDPFVIGARRSVGVDIDLVLPLPDNANDFQVRWTETVKDRNGEVVGSPSHWEARLTLVESAPPATEDKIKLNPMGLYITELSWTRLEENADAR